MATSPGTFLPTDHLNRRLRLVLFGTRWPLNLRTINEFKCTCFRARQITARKA
jgi:hypothetical protein